MTYTHFQFQVYYVGQQIDIKAVRISNSYLIYKDGKAQLALHKNAGKWEEIMSGSLPENLLAPIIVKLEDLQTS